MLTVLWHLRHVPSYRDLQEFLAAWGIEVDHAKVTTAGRDLFRVCSPD